MGIGSAILIDLKNIWMRFRNIPKNFSLVDSYGHAATKWLAVMKPKSAVSLDLTSQSQLRDREISSRTFGTRLLLMRRAN